MPPDPTFEPDVDPDAVGDALIVATSTVGMAGLTAVDHLVTDADADAVGHVAARGFPAVVPFADGTPRHHTRLFALPDDDVSVLLSELFLPPWAAGAFADGLLDLTTAAGVDEVAVLNAVPYQHGPDEHAVFHVATPEFRARRIDGRADTPEGTDDAGAPPPEESDDAVPGSSDDVDPVAPGAPAATAASDAGSDEVVSRPLSGGFLDGVAGELLELGLDGTVPAVGAFVTPAHPPGPDLDAAVLFLSALRSAYGVDVDPSDLQARSEGLKRYYSELADRARRLESDRDASEDRAYM